MSKSMNSFLNLCLYIVVLSLFTVMFTPVTIFTTEQKPIINKTEIVSNSEIRLDFARMENKGVSFQFVGLSISCVQAVEVIGLAVYNDDDGSYIPTNLYDTFSQLADTCIVQAFCFTVHGGKLRRQINKDGLATIYLISDAQQAYKLQLTEFGEQEIIRVLDNK